MQSLLSIYDTNNNLKAYHTSYATSNLSSEPQIANMYAVTSRQELRSFLSFLKLNSLLRVSNAVDITVVDNINKELRFNITYQFQSVTSNNR